MTEILDAAVLKLAALPAEEQDRIAQWLLQELWHRDFLKLKTRQASSWLKPAWNGPLVTQANLALASREIVCAGAHTQAEFRNGRFFMVLQ